MPKSMTSARKPITVGIVGCGAVAERFHLPALYGRRDVAVNVVIDTNLDRAHGLADRFGVPNVAPDISHANPCDFNAAIVALPHFLHAPVCAKLLHLGKHVLVEKPMALTTNECDLMIAAAADKQVTLTVGQMRRNCPAVSATKSLLEQAFLGQIKRFDIRDGVPFNWPVASDFLFRKETAGGGVLMDAGAHTLDMAIWLLGDLDVTAYRDDAFGGVEADCEIELHTVTGIPGHIELSRTRNLRNSMLIEGSNGRLELFFYDNRAVLHDLDTRTGIPQVLQHDAEAVPEQSVWPLMFRLQLDAWLRCVRAEAASTVPGEEGRRVVSLIEDCYRMREPLELPWVLPTSRLPVA